MEQITLRELLEAQLAAHSDKLDTIIALQRETNGRVRKAEIAIAILQVGYVVGGAVAAWVVFK